MLQFEMFVNHFLIIDVYVQKMCRHRFATMPRLNERQRGEAIGFLLIGEDQISVPERFHVSQSTLSRLRRRMLTIGSLHGHFTLDVAVQG
jgi:hypothetical protein